MKILYPKRAKKEATKKEEMKQVGDTTSKETANTWRENKGHLHENIMNYSYVYKYD